MDADDSKIIRDEAKVFFRSHISGSDRTHAVDDMHELKTRLDDFYSSESKAIFLDEIEIQIRENLKSHRDKSHGGKASPTCQFEIRAEKLRFYIKQEIGTLPAIAHQKFNSVNNSLARNKVFVSYSRADVGFLTDVQRHFKPFLGEIDYWDDSKISPGKKWKEEIRQVILATKIAVLIVSTDFLGSEFIATDELPPLLQAAEKEGAVILILIARPCLFEEFNNLNQYQAMNPPSRPISKMDEDEREELLVNLVRQTKKILEQ
ncbi:MAG TPA: toll/interleukin-1 receptor domain-containing protein [Flavobacterium sp.]|nr:toll/interleukin-1 receptor domain-containing protein [Flavobacterium sp.]